MHPFVTAAQIFSNLEQIVDQGSARLDALKKEVISLEANHIGICKFSSRDSANYQSPMRILRYELSLIGDTTSEVAHTEALRQLEQLETPVTLR
jgi:hypothetical protein